MLRLTDPDDSHGAQRVVDYLGLVGLAALADTNGELHLSSVRRHSEKLLAFADLVTRASRAGQPDPLKRIVCLSAASGCAYCASVGSGHVLFVIADESMSPAAVIERLTSAVAVFDRVMARAAAPPGAPGGASGSGPDSAVAVADIAVERGRSA